MFIHHPVAIVSITKPGNYALVIKPAAQGKELFKLKSVIVEPVK